MLFEPAIATAAFGGLTGFLVGYFIRKIVKVVLFARWSIVAHNILAISGINYHKCREDSALY